MANSKPTKKPLEPEVTPAESKPEVNEVSDKQASNWNINGVFWGFLLIVVGGLLLLSNFGVVTLDWSNVWRIWPIAIIVAGLSVLSLRSTAWKVVSALLMILALAAIVLLATGNLGKVPESFQLYTSNVQSVGSDVTNADVTVNAGASKINVRSENLDVAAKATLRSNITRLVEKSSIQNHTQYVTLSSESNNGLWFSGNMKNEWDILIDQDRPTKLTIDAGASDIDLDVSQAIVDQLTLKAGASSSRITVGDKSEKTNLKIDSGASAVVVRVPKSSGASVRIDGGLVSKQLADLRQVTDGYYETDGFSTAAKQIVINADIGAANFTIERY